MIAIVDYGMGNLRSVQKALQRVGSDAVIVREPEAIDSASKLILPGVGAFGDAMTYLAERGQIEPIKRFVASGRPFLGICLGMQLVFESSDEDAPSPPGLGLLRGRVVRFDKQRGGGIKVPHMGWNTLRWRRNDPLFAGLEQDSAVYFVHGYYAKPDNGSASAMCDYGGEFCASVWHDNLWATQFHPEKSQRIGLKILANFAEL